MKLNVGCGVDLLIGYVNIDNLSDYLFAGDAALDEFQKDVNKETPHIAIDVHRWINEGAFVRMDLVEYLNTKVKDNSVHEILSDRFIGRNYADEWELFHKKLKTGGKLIARGAIGSFVDVYKLMELFGNVEMEFNSFDGGDYFFDLTLTKIY